MALPILHRRYRQHRFQGCRCTPSIRGQLAMEQSRFRFEELLAVVLVLLLGCSSSSARVTVLPRPGASSSQVAKVTVTVSAPGEETATENLPRASDQWTGVIDGLTVGAARTLQAVALDAGGTRLYTGQATDVTMEADEETLVFITLDETTPTRATEPEAPILASLTAHPAEVRAGGTVVLHATVRDRNPGDAIRLEWTAQAGSFSAAEGGRVTWTAPASGSTFTLGCAATDPQGLSASLVLPVSVRAPSTASPSPGKTCCKHCGSGSKPCGDSCINSGYKCSKPSGCAC
jgi:hypothetical protein